MPTESLPDLCSQGFVDPSIQPCEHQAFFFPSERPVNHPPWWKFWVPLVFTHHWYCLNCGVELEPVFREKRQGGSPNLLTERG